MKLLRRQFLKLAAGGAALPAVSRVATAQTYPTRPITMIVPVAAGGTVDALARILADRMRLSLRQPVIVENVSGADGSIGVGRAARASPDGYTIDLGQLPTHVLNGAFYSLPYDVLNDFAPIAPLTTMVPILLGGKSIPARDLHELITWLKANPDKASAGVVTLGNKLPFMLFQRETGTRLILVPYRGGAQAAQDLVAGQINLSTFLPDFLPSMQAAGMKAFAVASDTRLVAAAPDIPTFRELGLPTLSYAEWIGLFAPRGTPTNVIGRLNAAAVEALADPAVRSRFEVVGEVFPRDRQTPEALGEMVKADAAKWWPIIKELGIKAE